MNTTTTTTTTGTYYEGMADHEYYQPTAQDWEDYMEAGNDADQDAKLALVDAEYNECLSRWNDPSLSRRVRRIYEEDLNFLNSLLHAMRDALAEGSNVADLTERLGIVPVSHALISRLEDAGLTVTKIPAGYDVYTFSVEF